jgi:hypothetical protein
MTTISWSPDGKTLFELKANRIDEASVRAMLEIAGGVRRPPAGN